MDKIYDDNPAIKMGAGKYYYYIQPIYFKQFEHELGYFKFNIRAYVKGNVWVCNKLYNPVADVSISEFHDLEDNTRDSKMYKEACNKSLVLDTFYELIEDSYCDTRCKLFRELSDLVDSKVGSRYAFPIQNKPHDYIENNSDCHKFVFFLEKKKSSE
ncbi:MAG: hypothetical protein ACRCST_11610 [Turicibacter sp.]